MNAKVRIGVARSVGVTRLPLRMVDAAVTLAHLERFCHALERTLGITAEPLQTRSYSELVKAFAERELDLAWLPPVVALEASNQGLARPLVAPVRGGASTFHAALFSPSKSRLERVADIAGARVAWVDRESAAGYVVVRAALRAEAHDLARMFSAETFHGSHQAVVQAVVDGTADVGATYLHRDERGALLRAGWGSHDMRPVFEHGPIPSDVLAAASGIERELAQRVADELCASTSSHLLGAARLLFEADRFARVDRDHLATLAPLLSHIDDEPRR